MILGLTILIYLAHGSMSKALIMAAFGIVLGLIGLDSINARPRFTFGRMELIDGVGLVPIVMGLFGISEVLLNIEQVVQTRYFKDQDQGTSAHGQRLERQRGTHGQGISFGVSSWGSFPAEARSFPLLFLMPSKKGYPSIRSVSGKGPSKGWPDRRRPTMRPPGGPSSPS